MVKEPVEVQRADAGARRKALVLIVVGAMVGAVLILCLEDNRVGLERWLSGDGDVETGARRLRLALVVVALTATLPLLGFSTYLRRFAGRIESSQRFPPPGLAVLRDTLVLEGADALAHASRLRLVACSIAILALAVPVVMWRVASVLSA